MNGRRNLSMKIEKDIKKKVDYIEKKRESNGSERRKERRKEE